MSMIETCIVCKHKFNGLTNKSHYDLYRDALSALKKKRISRKGFVCSKCAHSAATVKCAICRKGEHEFNDINFFSPDAFSKWGIKHERQYLARVQQKMMEFGSSFTFDEKTIYVCDSCIIELLNRTRTAAIKKVGTPKRKGQTLWLKDGIISRKGCCCRCGTSTKENFIDFLRSYVDFFFMPFCKEYWDGVHAYLRDPSDENLKLLHDDVGKSYYFENFDADLGAERFVDDLFDRHVDTQKALDYEKRAQAIADIRKWYRRYRQLVSPFANGKTLCKECCAFLMSECVKADYEARRENWVGCVKADSLPGYFRRISFAPIQLNGRDDGGWDELREAALLMGANGIVNFKQTNETDCQDHQIYDWIGTPVLFEKGQYGDECGDSVIVDGSNLILADNSQYVLGLKACLKGLKKRKIKCFVFFDANIFHKLEKVNDGKTQIKELKSLIAQSKGGMALVPAGSRADDFILKKADTDGKHILSNDRYAPYVERYPWIAQDRVHRFSFVDGRLMIPDLDVDIVVCK